MELNHATVDGAILASLNLNELVGDAYFPRELFNQFRKMLKEVANVWGARFVMFADGFISCDWHGFMQSDFASSVKD